jgi:zinc protease
MKKDFRTLPEGAGFHPRQQAPSLIEHTRAEIVDKQTRSVAVSIGFPITMTRVSPDYAAMLVATSYFGQHRMSSGVLYQAMREKRGLNYGDYAYIEYFPRGMFRFQPEPNLARHWHIFQIWVRPVEPANAKFAVRMALYELDKLIKDGISEEGFELTREFLSKYVNVLTATRSAELGYAIDSIYFNMPDYAQALKDELARLTREQVNKAIRRYLRTDRLVIVAVAANGEALKQQLASPDPSPIAYNSPKPDAILEEDKTIENWPLNLAPENITVIPGDKVFQ